MSTRQKISTIILLFCVILQTFNSLAMSQPPTSEVSFICEGPRRGHMMIEISYPLSCITSADSPYDNVKDCTLFSPPTYLGEKPNRIKITEQSQNEEKVIFTGEKYQVILTKSSFTAVITRPDGGILECKKKI